MNTDNQTSSPKPRRRKILRIAVVGLLVVLLVGFVVSRSQTPMPSYSGKTLDQWLEMKGGIEPLPDEAAAAVRQMGTNALPRLLELLTHEDSAVKTLLYQNLPNIGNLRSHITPHYVIQDRGVEGLRALGRAAKPALPQLCRLYEERGSLEIASVLVEIGSDGARVVETGLTNSDAQTRRLAIIALSHMTNDPVHLKTAFQMALSDSDEFVREAATNALADIK
jgi:HEAT repeat protein